MIIDFKSQRNFEKYFTSILFAVSSWIFLFSSVYARNGNTYLGINYSQLIVFFIIGAMHAIVDILYYKRPMLYYKWGQIELKVNLFIRWLTMSFAYTGIYQCILLPFSGLGFIEWLFVAALLCLMIFNYVTCPKNVVVKSPALILIFQVVLLFIKVFTWIVPENIYRELITGNDTARWIVAILFSFFIITGILTLRRKVLPVTKEQANGIKKFGQKISKGIKKFGQMILNFFMKAINLIMSLSNGPIIILVIIGVIVILFFYANAFGFGLMIKIKTDLLNFIEPILTKLLSTGKYQVQQTPIYIFCQLISIILYGFYQFLIIPIEVKDDALYDCIEDSLEEDINNFSEKDRNSVLNRFKLLYKNEKNEVIYNVNAYKEKCIKELQLLKGNNDNEDND